MAKNLDFPAAQGTWLMYPFKGLLHKMARSWYSTIHELTFIQNIIDPLSINIKEINLSIKESIQTKETKERRETNQLAPIISNL